MKKQNFKYLFLLFKSWKLNFGGIPIIQTRINKNNPSLAFNKIISNNLNSNNFTSDNNIFIPNNNSLIKQYGGCSSVVEYPTVARGTWVRFPASAFWESNFDYFNLARVEVPENSKGIVEDPASAYFQKEER